MASALSLPNLAPPPTPSPAHLNSLSVFYSSPFSTTLLQRIQATQAPDSSQMLLISSLSLSLSLSQIVFALLPREALFSRETQQVPWIGHRMRK